MNEYLTVNQASILLHVSSTTIRRWIYQGSLKAQKMKTGRNARVLIKKDDLDEMLVPVQQTSSQSYENRKAVVERILILRQQFLGRNINVDDLIEQNRQERDHE
jgi:excisionase family DNA binding protein